MDTSLSGSGTQGWLACFVCLLGWICAKSHSSYSCCRFTSTPGLIRDPLHRPPLTPHHLPFTFLPLTTDWVVVTIRSILTQLHHKPHSQDQATFVSPAPIAVTRALKPCIMTNVCLLLLQLTANNTGRHQVNNWGALVHVNGYWKKDRQLFFSRCRCIQYTCNYLPSPSLLLPWVAFLLFASVCLLSPTNVTVTGFIHHSLASESDTLAQQIYPVTGPHWYRTWQRKGKGRHMVPVIDLPQLPRQRSTYKWPTRVELGQPVNIGVRGTRGRTYWHNTVGQVYSQKIMKLKDVQLKDQANTISLLTVSVMMWVVRRMLLVLMMRLM